MSRLLGGRSYVKAMSLNSFNATLVIWQKSQWTIIKNYFFSISQRAIWLTLPSILILMKTDAEAPDRPLVTQPLESFTFYTLTPIFVIAHVFQTPDFFLANTQCRCNTVKRELFLSFGSEKNNCERRHLEEKALQSFLKQTNLRI